jgi:cytoskeletal protein RodZ
LHLNDERSAELARLGNDFRLARMSIHVSLEDASRATRIRAIFLKGIERGDLSLYSSGVIAAGHAKIYARFLRIDHRPYVAVVQAQENETVIPPAARASPAISRRRAINPAPLAFLSALVVLSIYLYIQFETFVRTADAPQIAAVPTTVIVSTPLPTRTIVVAEIALAPTSTTERVPLLVAQTPTPVPSPLPTAAIVPTPTPTRNPGILIDAVTSDRAWVQVESDNRVVFSGTLNPGEHRSWAAAQRLMLWTGNAAGVSVTYNGKSLGRLGAVGEVVKLTWTATS